MIITVMGPGESCADPDKYVQAISAEALSQFGVPQRSGIIITPDYPLLVGMGCILILSTGVVMLLIAYCLHKQWKIAKVKRGGYRLLHADVSILHSEEATYGAKANDFEMHRSRPDSESSAEEDDLDDINMDIYTDLVEAGDAFLSIYGDVKTERTK